MSDCTTDLCEPQIFPPLGETCDTKICGSFETCTTCGVNFCNTYSCANFGGFTCKFACVDSPPTCICEPFYHRVRSGAPCTRIRCPQEISASQSE